MYYKIQTDNYPQISDFTKGFGFYLVHNTSGGFKDVHYFNPVNNFWLTLDGVMNLPKEFLDLFEQDVVEETKQKEGYVSESFALKAMALAKANTNTIKVSDILNNE